MRFSHLAFACFIMILPSGLALGQETSRHTLVYAPSPVDNPLRGLVPYQADVRSYFPHSLEFNYLPFSALVAGEDEYDWKPLEKLLNNIASRGHQTVFRVYLEYPGKTGVIPEYLIKNGLKVHKYVNTNTHPLPPAKIETPDYADPNLRRAMTRFVAALGKKYDGDPRLGFITAGLLGTWGEWHCYPRNELFASKAVQTEIMDAYEAAFKITPVLLRYPAGPNTWEKADNKDRRFGYHDDSFAWATLHTGRKNEEWYYETALRHAGPAAVNKWKTQPIGGEIRPEAWRHVFDETTTVKEVQDFVRCVEVTHATWLMDSGMFQKKPPADRVERAKQKVSRMGYEFHARSVTIHPPTGQQLKVEVEIENRGVAPFYYDWPIELGLVQSSNVIKSVKGNGKLTGLVPGEAARVWKEIVPLDGIDAGEYQIVLRVPNPLKNGHPMRFANSTQDQNVPGWLTLGHVRVK
jgi:hypothetical protein